MERTLPSDQKHSSSLSSRSYRQEKKKKETLNRTAHVAQNRLQSLSHSQGGQKPIQRRGQKKQSLRPINQHSCIAQQQLSLPDPLPQKKNLLDPFLKDPETRRLNQTLFNKIVEMLPDASLHQERAAALLTLLQRNMQRGGRAFKPYESILYRLIREGKLLPIAKQQILLELFEKHLSCLHFTNKIPEPNQLIGSLASWCWKDSRLVALAQKIFLGFLTRTSYPTFGSEKEAIQATVLVQLTLYPWKNLGALSTPQQELFNECVSFAIKNNNWKWMEESLGHKDISSLIPLLLKEVKEQNPSAIQFYGAHREWFPTSGKLEEAFQDALKQVNNQALRHSADLLWQRCFDKTQKFDASKFHQIVKDARSPKLKTLLYLNCIAHDPAKARSYWETLMKEDWNNTPFHREMWEQFKISHKQSNFPFPLLIYRKFSCLPIEKEELVEFLSKCLHKKPKWKVKGLQLLIQINQEAKSTKIEKEICFFLEQLIDISTPCPQSLLVALFKRIEEGTLTLSGEKRVLLALIYPQLATSYTLKQAWPHFEMEVQSCKEFPKEIKEKIKFLIQIGAGDDFLFLKEKFFSNPALYGERAPELLAQFLQKTPKEKKRKLLMNFKSNKFLQYLQGSSYADEFSEFLKKPRPQSPPFSWETFPNEAKKRPRQAAIWLLQQATQENEDKEKALLLIKEYFVASPIKHPIIKYFSPLREQNSEALSLLPPELHKTITDKYLKAGKVKEAAWFILKSPSLKEFLPSLFQRALIQSDVDVVREVIETKGIEPAKEIISFLNEKLPQAWKTLQKALCKTPKGCEDFLRNRIESNALFGRTSMEKAALCSLLKHAIKRSSPLISSKEELCLLLTTLLMQPNDSFEEKITFARHIFSLWKAPKEELARFVIYFFEDSIKNKCNTLTDACNLFYFSEEILLSIDKNPYTTKLPKLLSILASPLYHHLMQKHLQQDEDTLSAALSLFQRIISNAQQAPFFSPQEINEIFIFIQDNKKIPEETIKALLKASLTRLPDTQGAKKKIEYLAYMKDIYLNLVMQQRISSDSFKSFLIAWIHLFFTIPKKELIDNREAHKVGMSFLLLLEDQYEKLFNATRDEITLLSLLLRLRGCSIHFAQHDMPKNLKEYSRNLCLGIKNILEQASDAFSLTCFRYASSLVKNLDFLFHDTDLLIEEQAPWIRVLELIFKKISKSRYRPSITRLATESLRNMLDNHYRHSNKIFSLLFCEKFILKVQKEIPNINDIFWFLLAKRPTKEVIHLISQNIDQDCFPTFQDPYSFWKALINKRIDILIKKQSEFYTNDGIKMPLSSSVRKNTPFSPSEENVVLISHNTSNILSDPLVTLLSSMNREEWKEKLIMYIEIYKAKYLYCKNKKPLSLFVTQNLLKPINPEDPLVLQIPDSPSYELDREHYHSTMVLHEYIQGYRIFSNKEITNHIDKENTDIVGKILKLKIIQLWHECKRNKKSIYKEKGHDKNELLPFTSDQESPIIEQCQRFFTLAHNHSPDLCYIIKIHLACWLTFSAEHMKTSTMDQAQALWQEAYTWGDQTTPALDYATQIAFKDCTTNLLHFYTDKILLLSFNEDEKDIKHAINKIKNILETDLSSKSYNNLFIIFYWVNKVLENYAFMGMSKKSDSKKHSPIEEIKDYSLELIEKCLNHKNKEFSSHVNKYIETLLKNNRDISLKMLEVLKTNGKIKSCIEELKLHLLKAASEATSQTRKGQ